MGRASSTSSKGGTSSSGNAARRPHRRGVRRITRELERLEAQFPSLQRMECMSLLTGGLVHDFNNVLTVIQVCALDLALSEEVQGADEHMHDMMAAVSLGKTLTARMLSLTREESHQPATVNLHQVAMGCRRLLRWTAGPELEVQISAAQDLGLVWVDVVQVEQILMNLVANASHVMQGLGTARVFLANRDPELRRGTGELPRSSSPGHVVLEVVDHGCGMDQHTREQIFEPMFSTKPPSEGTGLGLFMVSRLVAQNGGTISVESAPMAGSTFSIYFPRVD